MSRKDIMIQVQQYAQACCNWALSFDKNPSSDRTIELNNVADSEQIYLQRVLDLELYNIELSLNDKLNRNQFGMLTIKVDPLRESNHVTLIGSNGRIGDFPVQGISKAIANALLTKETIL